MAINVIQFEGVRTSPSGGGGNGLASGASTLICVEVILIDLLSEGAFYRDVELLR
jgi:hypothetical protein